jgi:2-dehydro-3-deoxygluconokinase
MSAHRDLSPRLVTVGETLILLYTPESGRLRDANRLRVAVGGAESNVAIAVRRLGCPAEWIGRVGDDEFGELVLRTLRGEGVDVAGVVRDPTVSTSLMIKERRTPDTARVTYYRKHGPGARLRPDDLDEDAIARAAVLHLTGITPALSPSARETVRAAADIALAARVPVSLDVNYRSALWSPAQARAELIDLCRGADHVFVGHAEARVLGFDGDAVTVAQELQELGPGVVVVKRGRRGAVALDGGELIEVEPIPVTSVDPVGAGDAFAGGYLAEMLAGRSPAERLRTAAACGAYAVTGRGDWEALPMRADLEQLEDEPGKVVR